VVFVLREDGHHALAQAGRRTQTGLPLGGFTDQPRHGLLVLSDDDVLACRHLTDQRFQVDLRFFNGDGR